VRRECSPGAAEDAELTSFGINLDQVGRQNPALFDKPVDRLDLDILEALDQ